MLLFNEGLSNFPNLDLMIISKFVKIDTIFIACGHCLEDIGSFLRTTKLTAWRQKKNKFDICNVSI